MKFFDVVNVMKSRVIFIVKSLKTKQEKNPEDNEFTAPNYSNSLNCKNIREVNVNAYVLSAVAYFRNEYRGKISIIMHTGTEIPLSIKTLLHHNLSIQIFNLI